MKFFVYDNASGDLQINDEGILTIQEFANLMDLKRNISKTDKTGKNKELAFKEFKYIYLFLDWGSPYFQYVEQLRHDEALKDSGLTKVEFDNELFRNACKKYDEIQNSSLDIKLLKASMSAVEKQIEYLNNVDLSERDPATGKPIFKSKDLIAEIKGCKDLISSLRELESQVKKGIETESSLRGGVETGVLD